LNICYDAFFAILVVRPINRS